jgi:hypothetical protein
METYVRRSFNYLDRMTDKDGLPYFNIFWTEPAEAAHDWPDFGDVMSRQLQAAVMARRLTGREALWEKRWLKKVLGYIDPASGLLVRPETPYSRSVADPGDQALTLYALVTAYLDAPDKSVGETILKMADGIRRKLEEEGEKSEYLSGFLIKSLMAAARGLDSESAFIAAGKITRHIFEKTTTFAPDNHFRQGGHMHGNLRTILGVADFALMARDPELFSRADALYRYVRSESTRFGFLPEEIGRHGDIVLCETCALMDFIGLAATLANHGHPEYWDDVERAARNQLIESQLADASWLKGALPSAAPEDTAQFSRRSVGERMIGGYAGWSSPTHFLAARETLNAHWGGPELKNKTRAFQNCCGGSGTHAFYIVWKNAARYEDGCLTINLHLDKLLPQAEIRCYQPREGLLTVDLRQDCRVRVRVPSFLKPGEIKAEAGEAAIEPRLFGNYLELDGRRAGERIRVTYPLPVYREEAEIGNPGFARYRYRVTWKGDTVIRMEPIGDDRETGYSDFDKRQVPVFYGREGPCPLYQRDGMMSSEKPKPAELYLDSSPIDFWSLKENNRR